MSTRRCLLYAIAPIAIAITALAVWEPDALSPTTAPERDDPRLVNQRLPAASRLSPDPEHPERDRSAMQDDGCLIKLESTEQRPCVYGDRDSPTTVVLFGDSLAMAYFPAIEVLAGERGWRLVGITKAGCPPVIAPVYNHRLERPYRECSAWRRGAIDRIEQDENPALVLVTGRMSTPATRDGRTLDIDASRVALERGYVAMLERLRATGAEVVALKDLPRSPRNVPDCVLRHLEELRHCNFRATTANTERFDARAVEAVPGTRMIDLIPTICPHGVCRAVIGDMIVFRDYDHMTPTFARTLAPIIRRQLPAVGR